MKNKGEMNQSSIYSKPFWGKGVFAMIGAGCDHQAILSYLNYQPILSVD
ncbi:hypothetical protein [Vibrio diabolicus]